ncbi:ParB/RepB/Spo0J family partition protein [Streptomyces sp. CRN 30]|uniref:ParB/RepB/Spo0J family partition protein n=1 Tax=Streptomyces sp. CRN 30 TaxID=3075613 RepID=UPI002A81CF59|nr:ParB/RepB/Spo0J family partition protein [Streptomyces sp. CRN 30]
MDVAPAGAAEPVRPAGLRDETPDEPEPLRLPIRTLLLADSPRLDGEDLDHVRALAEVDEELLPPVVVHRATMRIIDGRHRLLALRMRGIDTVRVRFDDSAEDPFVLAVQHNVEHGLPLSLADRSAAATRILGSHPHWSDRKIAAVAGLSPGTVRTLRACSTDDSAQSNTRLGRDGRRRPAGRSAEGRVRAGELLRENPDMPLRQVAAAAGISPSTALDVRDRVRDGRDPVPAKLRDGHHKKRKKPAAEAPAPRSAVDWESELHRLRVDPSLRYTDTGRFLLRLFDARLLSTDERALLATGVPSHCTTTVANLARVVGAAWHQLAVDLEQREQNWDEG